MGTITTARMPRAVRAHQRRPSLLKPQIEARVQYNFPNEIVPLRSALKPRNLMLCLITHCLVVFVSDCDSCVVRERSMQHDCAEVCRKSGTELRISMDGLNLVRAGYHTECFEVPCCM